jgi:acetyl esterase/lipase
LRNDSPQAGDGVRIGRNIYYLPSDPAPDPYRVHHTLDVYAPPEGTVSFAGADKRYPVVFFVHGGSFVGGDKTMNGFSYLSRTLARQGIVAVSINYRLLSPTGCGGNPDPTPTCVNAAIGAQHDAQAAVRWLRANAATYKIDTSRIAIAGASAGAVTSLLVDWRPEDPGTSGNPGYSSKVRAAVSVSGGAPTNEYIDSSDSPAIFFHGTEDKVVPYKWAVQNAAAMYKAGIFTVLEPIEGAAHGLLANYGDLIREQSDYFLYFAMDMSHAEQ